MRVIHYIGELGFGGDCKNLIQLARQQVSWCKPVILTGKSNPIIAESLAQEQQISLVTGITDAGSFASYFTNSESPSICIIHRNGKPNQAETEILEQLKKLGIPCFEYNTFAWPDDTTDHLWSGHCHLSRASFYQYAKRKGDSVSALAKKGHQAIGYAVTPHEPSSLKSLIAARQALGIPDNKLVFTRLLRPDLRKWDPLPVLGVKRALEKGVPAHLIVQSPPPSRINWIKKELPDCCTILPVSVDPAEIGMALQAADCLVNCCGIGETFGLAMAEGMQLGLPCLVNATPDQDNAQVEFIKPDETGWIANSVEDFADTAIYMHHNRELVQAAGQRAQIQTNNWFAPEVTEKRLRSFIRLQLQAQGFEFIEKIPVPDNFVDDYTLDQIWLEHWNAIANNCSTKNNKITDALELSFLRLWDASTYAGELGPKRVLSTIIGRLQRGSFKRG